MGRFESGVVELASDRPKDEPGGFRTLAAETLTLVLLERDHQIGEHLVEAVGPVERAGRNGGIQAGDRCSGVPDGMSRCFEPLSEGRAGGVGARPGRGRGRHRRIM